MQQTQSVKEATQLRPLGNRVLVKRLKVQQELQGGIFLPDSAKQTQEQAEVIAIGTGKKDKNGTLIPIPVVVGNIILMDKYAGTDVKLNDEEYIIVKADDIIAIIED